MTTGIAGGTELPDTDASTSIFAIPVDSAATSGFFVITIQMLREKWLMRQGDRVATGARYWRRRRLPGWLR
jgi:hypothetical protein